MGGVAIGRALTDNLLLLENLATQNLFDVESAEAGSSLSVARYRCTQSFGSRSQSHWVKWNVLDFGSKNAFEYNSGTGNRIYIKQDGIYHMSMHFMIDANANNYADFYYNSQHRVRAWSSCRSNYWQDMGMTDLFRAKKDNYVAAKVYWNYNGKGWEESGQNSGLTLMRIKE